MSHFPSIGGEPAATRRRLNTDMPAINQRLQDTQHTFAHPLSIRAGRLGCHVPHDVTHAKVPARVRPHQVHDLLRVLHRHTSFSTFIRKPSSSLR